MISSYSTVWVKCRAYSQRSFIFPAAIYASSVLTSGLLAAYIILLPSLGILIISFVMIKGTVNKFTAYLGLITGILGIVAVAGDFFTSFLGLAVVATSVLTTFWVLFVGYGLFRLSK